MSKIFIQPYEPDKFDSFLALARENDYNLEIASFAFGDTLDSNWKEILEDYKRKLQGFGGIISTHGAFMDLILNSRDKKVAEIARNRINHSLEIADELGAKYIDLHTNFNPMITHESYKLNWIEQNALFWSETLPKHDLTVLIENIWEPGPELFRKLLDTVNSPKLRICLDIGHVNVFSKAPLEKWLDILRDDIPYMHINDNHGDHDSESVPGEGNIDWRLFSDLIHKYGLEPNLVFEVGALEDTKRAIRYFEDTKIYPFD
jgi:sugar phosphate isomerase/epimerase